MVGFLLPALILGASLGIFLHGYWLVDLLPVDSKRLIFSTLLAGFLGTLGYAVLLRLVRKELTGISWRQCGGLIVAGVLTGIFLFFSASGRWQSPIRYVTFALPEQTLRVSVPAGQAPGAVSIGWIKTSLGDVSYDEIQFAGWEREADRLVLVDPQNNSLSWNGKTGADAQIVFEVPERSGEVHVSWNGREEIVRFSAEKNAVNQTFDIPFYASRGMVLALGILNSIALSFALCLVVWNRRVETLQAADRSFTGGVPGRFDTWEWAVIGGMLLLAALLRLPNLDNLYPGVDEYYQLIAARQITQGVPMAEVYSRSLWLVTMPAVLMFKWFGYELWAARLPGAVMNVLAVIPLYLLARRLNRPVAVLSVLIYAVSPWVITFGRIVREYAIYPFLFYLIVYGMVLFLDGIPRRLRLERDFRIFLTPKMLLLSMGFFLLPVYAFYVDVHSTFKLIVIVLALFGVFILSRLDWESRTSRWTVLLLAGAGLSVAIFWFGRLQLSAGFNPSVLGYFFANPPQQWYFNRLALIPMVGLAGAFALSFIVRRTNVVPLFILSLFGGLLAFFIFSSNDFQGTRHLTTTHLWYIVLVAMGLYLVWLFLQLIMKSHRVWSMVVIIAVLGALVWNVQQSLMPVLEDDPYMSISTDYHHDMSAVHEYMLANTGGDDVLIASIYGLYAQWTGAPLFRDIHRFGTQTPAEDVLSIIAGNESGWIVIDSIRAQDAAFPVFETLSEDGRVEYVGLFGDEHVWRWRDASSQP